MKRTLLALLAVVTLNGSAQATTYTFEYTAVVNHITLTPIPWNVPTDVASTSLDGGVVSLGDVVKGVLVYDSDMTITATESFETDAFHKATFVHYNADHMQLSGKFEAANVGFAVEQHLASYGGQVSYPHDWTDAQDYFFIGGSSSTDNNRVMDSMSITYSDTHARLDLAHAPGSEATSFNNNQFSFMRSTNTGSIGITSDLTSLRLISAVPEPETYAMLLAGLALLAWRRRTRSDV
ncbi:PEP-CTERM sorting domain-containing protein [Duganella sp. S19_KUP01_CR8]|uniref:PEP-CTERM sorting domain-containing protein n=1 Tax=Duganella sp. S19_KUP01_CR8 TaxID=3025502 RepID=UPI002FCDD0F0